MSEIREYINREPLFCTHDHQNGFEHDWETAVFADLIAYANSDLTVAGKSFDPDSPKDLFEVWPFVRTAGYGQATELAGFCQQM